MIAATYHTVTFWVGGISHINDIPPNVYSDNFTGLADGIYNYYVVICDISSNCNQTSTRTITLDTTPPSLSFVSPSPDNENKTEDWVYINITSNEALNWSMLEWNGTNISWSGNISATNFFINKTGISGNYTFKVFGNDSLGNMNVSETRWVWANTTITIPPVVITPPAGGGGGGGSTASISLSLYAKSITANGYNKFTCLNNVNPSSTTFIITFIDGNNKINKSITSSQPKVEYTAKFNEIGRWSAYCVSNNVRSNSELFTVLSANDTSKLITQNKNLGINTTGQQTQDFISYPEGNGSTTANGDSKTLIYGGVVLVGVGLIIYKLKK